MDEWSSLDVSQPGMVRSPACRRILSLMAGLFPPCPQLLRPRAFQLFVRDPLATEW